jgi:carbonic anhydrase
VLLSRRGVLFGLLSCPCCAAATEAPKWNYDTAGPDKWGTLDPKFRICSSGTQQSPIDLGNSVHAVLQPVVLHWTPQDTHTVWNNGAYIEVVVNPGSTLTVGDQQYELQQFHFHTPSEHAVDGKHTAMEAHFVYQQNPQRLAVLGVFLVPGAVDANATLASVMKVAPATIGAKVAARNITPHQLLPTALSPTWRYEGSWTTPPCTQDVNWIVFCNNVPVAPDDIDALRRIYPHDARPLQPSNRRYVLLG